jgi:hypothetical protein
MWVLTLSGGALLEFLLFVALGSGILFLCLKNTRRSAVYIYFMLMLAYGSYVFFCHYIRCVNEWEIIGSADGGGYYIPCTLELSELDSWRKIWSRVWETPRYLGGGAIFFYFVPIKYLADWLQMDLHLALQISLMPFAAMICVVEYHILLLFGIADKEATRWSIGFGLLSSLFWLSSFIVRDLPICLAYAVVAYLIFSNMARWKKLLVGAAMVVVVANIRMSSGMGLVPLALLAFFGDPKKKTIRPWQFVGCIVIMFALITIYGFVDEVEEVSQVYMEIELSDQGGKSVLSSFNILPFGVSHVVKTLYAQFHPIPAWRNMFQLSYDDRLYAHNITRFPDVWVVFFRIAALVTLFFGCSNRQIRRKVFENKLLLYSCIYMLLLLCAQASTIEERRKLALYPVLFVPLVLFWNNMDGYTRKRIMLWAASLFLMVQFAFLIKNMAVF